MIINGVHRGSGSFHEFANYLQWSIEETITFRKQGMSIFLKIYTTLGYIVSLILLNLGHVFRFRIVSRMWNTYDSETRVPSSRRLVKQYNQELCISSNLRCFTKKLQSRPLNWYVHILQNVRFWNDKTFSHQCVLTNLLPSNLYQSRALSPLKKCRVSWFYFHLIMLWNYMLDSYRKNTSKKKMWT